MPCRTPSAYMGSQLFRPAQALTVLCVDMDHNGCALALVICIWKLAIGLLQLRAKRCTFIYWADVSMALYCQVCYVVSASVGISQLGSSSRHRLLTSTHSIHASHEASIRCFAQAACPIEGQATAVSTAMLNARMIACRVGAIKAVAASAGMSNVVVHAPPLPVQFGTYHSKAFMIEYGTGVRVIVHTANLIYVDCNNKSQGLWYQDFPPKVCSVHVACMDSVGNI